MLGFTRSVRAVGALTAAITLAGLAVAAPASADTGPNLKVTATVQEGRWLAGDAIPVELTLTNAGDAPATEIRGWGYTRSGSYFNITQKSWGDLYSQGPGASLAAGESRTYHLLGSVNTLREGNPVVQVGASGSVDADGSDNTVEITVPLVAPDTTDRVAGHLYGDRNHDGLPSPGEDLSGAEAHLIGPGMSHDLVATTDAAGRFSFDGLPVGSGYSLHIEKAPDGWAPPSSLPQLRLDGTGANTAIEILAMRPLSDLLRETITLDKKSYAVGATGTATVTLTNIGDQPLTGLYAGCDPAGNERDLVVPDEQWGAFSQARHEGKLAPGQRLVLKLPGKVPDKASYFGEVGFGCYFDDGKTYGAGPYAYASAKVPGKKADSKGQVWVDKNGNNIPDAGEGVAKARVLLTDQAGHLVAVTTADADGFATFKNVPVGPCKVLPAGAWDTVGGSDILVVAPPYGMGDWSLRVVAR